MVERTNRREFLDQSAGLMALVPTVGALSCAQASPSRRPEKISIAVMGVNDRGKSLISRFLKFPQVEISHICDPDASVVGSSVRLVEDSGRRTPKVAADFRLALDDPHVDALVCAAPDHWHALATILACQAGKDVYVEKPASHRLVEGRMMVQAAKKYGRVVQVGTQRRSGEDFQSAIDLVHSGRLGKVCFARAWANKVRPDIGRRGVTPPPQDLDFDLWCGPASNTGYRSNLVHYHWHWRWDYGTGECGNLGVHSMDIARWGLQVDYPHTICSGGGCHAWDDDKETPDTQQAVFDFDDVTLQWEHRMWSHRGLEGNQRWGVAFYGTDATLVCNTSGWNLYEGDKLVKSHEPFDCQTAHIANFLDCISTRALPNADIENGHRSAALAHLANIAWRTRSTISFDGSTESVVDNPAAENLLTGTYRPGFELPQI